MQDYLFSRLACQRVQDALQDTPVVLIHGPRQCGKTTLAKMAAPKHEYVTFDDETDLEAAKYDPSGFVSRLPEYVILDEIQRVPELFRSIKMNIDGNRKAGRFVLTGSANVLLLPNLSDSLAGRMEVINLLPLAYAEIAGRQNQTLLQATLDGSIEQFSPVIADDFSLASRLVEGGYPEPVVRESFMRKRRWHESYLETLIQRDIKQLGNIYKLDKIPALLMSLANHGAQLLNVSALSRDMGIDRATLNQYLNLLQQIFLVDILPPWFSNRNKRLVKTPKVHLVDTGLAAFLLGHDDKALEANRSLLGHLAESYVYTELKRHATALDVGLNFYHYRDTSKQEIDIVIESFSGALIAVEVKTAMTVTSSDFKILQRFREQHSEQFLQGIVFYEGKHIRSFGDRMLAVPLAYL